ncbi:MAG: DNA replication/repair protein RecF [Bacteroidetes bacterium]|nr:DNA replication/repair protein RecF [Bacteroidota bacterium]
MTLHKLSLVSFKNYAHADVIFSERFNCIVGNNGEGKTNLLDAIHYLSFTKSYFNPIDSQNIFHDAPLFVIQGEFKVGEKEEEVYPVGQEPQSCEVYCAQKKSERKQVKLNKKEVTRFADHIGMFPVVMTSPSDIELILEGSEIRRKFADSIISQYDRAYLEDIIAYTKVLLQRNAQLKQFSRKGSFDADALKIWDAQLVEFGKRIFNKRKEFSAEFEPIFQKYYELISGGKEKVEIAYQSQLSKGDFEALLNESQDKDRVMEYSTVGVHKDDWEFRMGESESANSFSRNYPAKKFASQGQQKSYLLAVKLAQFEFVKQHKQIIPILMLDDIHDKLDEHRTKRLIELVNTNDFGQVFITDTSKERIQKLFKGVNSETKLFKVKDGSIFE